MFVEQGRWLAADLGQWCLARFFQMWTHRPFSHLDCPPRADRPNFSCDLVLQRTPPSLARSYVKWPAGNSVHCDHADLDVAVVIHLGHKDSQNERVRAAGAKGVCWASLVLGQGCPGEKGHEWQSAWACYLRNCTWSAEERFSLLSTSSQSFPRGIQGQPMRAREAIPTHKA